MCTGHLNNSVCYLHRNHSELHRPSEPEPSGTSSAIRTRTVRKLVCSLPLCLKSLHKPCLLSAPEHSEPHQSSETLQNLVCTTPFETSSAICIGTLRNLFYYLHRNPSSICAGTLWNPYQPSPPEPSRTSSTICNGPNPPEPHQPQRTQPSRISWTKPFQNPVCDLHQDQNSAEPCLLSAPEPSGTLSAICIGTMRNLISFLRIDTARLCA